MGVGGFESPLDADIAVLGQRALKLDAMRWCRRCMSRSQTDVSGDRRVMLPCKQSRRGTRIHCQILWCWFGRTDDESEGTAKA